MSEASDSVAESAKASPHLRPLAAARRQVCTAILSVPLLTLLTGGGFPLLLAAIARPLFPHQAEGSLVSERGHAIGSRLIGQSFVGPAYLHPRPSAAGIGYDPLTSGGSNLSPSNPRLRDGASGDPAAGIEAFLGVRQLAENYRRQNGLPCDAAIPLDAVTRSASGLDPHISPENALLQARRIARVRGLNEATVQELIAEHRQDRQLGFLGEPRVSVLEVNLALDHLAAASAASSDR